MKKIIIALLVFSFASTTVAQVKLPFYPDSIFSTYYHQRVDYFKHLPEIEGEIFFIGDSITEGGWWEELFNDPLVKNRGINSDISAGVLKRIDEIAMRKPAKLFMLIGTNDLSRNISGDSLLKNILLIVEYLKHHSPTTKLYVQSILPVNDAFGRFATHTRKSAEMRKVNTVLSDSAEKHGYTFIDLYTAFADEEGKLRKELTNDGLHLTGKGYLLWKHLVYPYVYDLQQRPSLLPLPQRVEWNDGVFPFYACKTIVVKDGTLKSEALKLQSELKKKNITAKITNRAAANEPYIELQLGKVDAPQLTEEAYRLQADTDKIIISANAAHGVFNGIQTLLQLTRDGVLVNGCAITDWPAFAWRGYMIDVGRNYMSLDLLKQQIDVMAQYKLNVFHFHPTEEIAWRMESKQYPQLTAPEHMLRNKGLYYSEADIKELIAYCRERHITFLPEIDMPGHSAAFKRAMSFDMQSDSGLAAVKNILREFITTYDLPYIHIGADEVKITNKQFIPEVTTLIQSLGKKVIGWQPGGNFTDNTIRQLWMDDNGKITGANNVQYIDSRHLYLNHMDPLEAVVTIYSRKIGSKEKGDAAALGGILCMWHDRAVAKEDDVLHMNPVYPGMLAFAERSWRGGGQDGWIANISDGDEKAFAAFENRLLDHKKLYFRNKSFPYVKQSDIVWQLYGPFANGGDLSKKFAPEQSQNNQLKPFKEVKGGTIVLRHWWAPLIRGALNQPDDSTTWYATAKIWSYDAGEKPFWIGFNNLSRSTATDPPPAGAWDHKGSAVWVNGKLIAAPNWKHGGGKGHAEIPLTDEGYEYREPAKILLKKGWNTVLIKAPVGSLKGKDWQNPVKWMFTFVPVR